MQRKPLVILASFITKKVSVKKHNLIILYRNIRSLATRLCNRGCIWPTTIKLCRGIQSTIGSRMIDLQYIGKCFS